MADLKEKIRALPAAQPLLEALGGTARVHLVGGAVRDLLLGREPARDLDLVVEGDARPVAELLAARLDGQATAFAPFLTAHVAAGEFGYDLATARRERYPRPGALPEVEPATLEEDLLRRDFTVNAMAASLGPDDFGTVRAVPGAGEDLERGRLRILHDGSFLDDPTRLLRLVRYAARLDFAIDQRTSVLARQAVAADALDTLTGARIGAELRLLLDEPRAGAALGLAEGLGLLAALRPPLRWRPDLAARARALLDVPTVLLAAAAIDSDPEELRAALDDWRFPARERARIVTAVRDAPGLAESLASAPRPSEIAAAAERTSPEAMALAGAMGAGDAAEQWLSQLRHVRLQIGGEGLLAAGVPAGPAVGRGLRAALASKLDGEATTREDELAVALAAAKDEPR
jgi:tRNA nucleotidyltransferase (CCA-adding enzyme)